MQKKNGLVQGSVSDFKRIVENELKRKNYTMAAESLRQMRTLYPDREEFYLSRLNYLASLGRGQDIQKLLKEIDEKAIALSSAAKEVLAFWRA